MIESRPWCEEAERGLEISAGADLPIIRDEVRRGIAKLWRCENEKHAAWVVTRIDDEAERELVIVCGEGSGMHDFAPAFIDAARKSGLKIRTHITRPGLLRMWKRYGLELSEYVLRG